MKVSFADVKPSVLNWIITGFMVLAFIVLGKYVFNRYKVAGLTDLFNAA